MEMSICWSQYSHCKKYYKKAYINLHKPADFDTTGERRLILANNPVLGIFTGVSTFTGLLSRAIALSNSTDETFPGRLTPHERPWQNQRHYQYVDLVGGWRALEAQLSSLLKGTPKSTRTLSDAKEQLMSNLQIRGFILSLSKEGRP